MITAKPFIKYAGGKTSILPELIKRVPASYNTYHEAFVGGGALFFAQQRWAIISDINYPLIITYQSLQYYLEEVIHELEYHARQHEEDPDHYYNVRYCFNTGYHCPWQVAGAFIYLNKTCYNGLYRVNKKGEFNVPKGKQKNVTICDIETLTAASVALQGITIKCCDFRTIEKRKGDFYYLDPPYYNAYAKYDSSSFTADDHMDLRNVCGEIDLAGGYFMLSNSDTEFIRNLYFGYNIETVLAKRSVSRDKTQRGKVNELIIRNYE